MPLAVTIHEDTREACAQALDVACTRLGLTAIMSPVRMAGSDRWMARAVHTGPTGQGEAPTHTGPGR